MQSGDATQLSELEQEVADLRLQLMEMEATSALRGNTSALLLSQHAGSSSSPMANYVTGLDGNPQEVTWPMVRLNLTDARLEV